MKKNFLYSLPALVLAAVACAGLYSCGSDDDDNHVEEAKFVLLGEYRTPYINDLTMFEVWGSGGVSSTLHYATCKNFHSYVFGQDGKATFLIYHHKSCVREHKMNDRNTLVLNPVLYKGDTLDWYVEGKGTDLSYTVDYSNRKVTISDGKQFNLKVGNGQRVESLLDEHGIIQYVAGTCMDEKYNNVGYTEWLGSLYGSGGK